MKMSLNEGARCVCVIALFSGCFWFSAALNQNQNGLDVEWDERTQFGELNSECVLDLKVKKCAWQKTDNHLLYLNECYVMLLKM